MTKHFIRNRIGCLIVIVILAIPLLGLLSEVYSTRQRMAYYKSHILPGMSITDLIRTVGKPTRIVQSGESLGVATQSFHFPTLNNHTVLYVYPKEGLSYYNVFVFVDENTSRVISTVVERL